MFSTTESAIKCPLGPLSQHRTIPANPMSLQCFGTDAVLVCGRPKGIGLYCCRKSCSNNVQKLTSGTSLTWRLKQQLKAASSVLQQEAQLPQRNSAPAAHTEGAKPSSPLPLLLWLHLCVRSNPKPATNVRQACRP